MVVFHSLDYSEMHIVVVGKRPAGPAVFALYGGGGHVLTVLEGPDGAAEAAADAAVVGCGRGHVIGVFVRM